MTGAISTKSFRDADRVSFSQRVWDESGVDDGPFHPFMREQSIESAAAITASDITPVDYGRQFVVICTVAGNVKVAFSDSSTLTFPVTTGMTILPWQIIQVYVTGTTATATYYNLT